MNGPFSFFLFLLPCALMILSCAGVFTNPDLRDGVIVSRTREVPLPPADPDEELLFRALKDTGFARIPEHDFYRMQETFLNLAARAALPARPFLSFADTAAAKDITRTYNYDSPSFRPLRYLETVVGNDLSVYELRACSVPLLCTYLRAGIPVLAYGTVFVKKSFYKNPGLYNTNATDYPESPGLQGDVSQRLFRKLTTFELVTGYSKPEGPSQTLPGETGEAYLFSVRSRLNFMARADRSMIDMALTLTGGAPLGSNWLFSNFYVMVKRGVTADAITERLKPFAAQVGLTGDIPLPEKLL
ncbi:MAG: hypothetical protein V1913_08905 [Fibrobacterota bacterium]